MTKNRLTFPKERHLFLKFSLDTVNLTYPKALESTFN